MWPCDRRLVHCVTLPSPEDSRNSPQLHLRILPVGEAVMEDGWMDKICASVCSEKLRA